MISDDRPEWCDGPTLWPVDDIAHLTLMATCHRRRTGERNHVNPLVLDRLSQVLAPDANCDGICLFRLRDRSTNAYEPGAPWIDPINCEVYRRDSSLSLSGIGGREYETPTKPHPTRQRNQHRNCRRRDR